MLGERPETADEWCDFYLAKEEHEAIEAIDGRAEGPRLLGARKAQQFRQNQKDAREEARHEEAMDKASKANQLAVDAMSWGRCGVYLGVGAILLTGLIGLVRYLQQ